MAEIADYAVIGNCRSMALISSEGSIDWLCWPQFDADPLFAELVNQAGGGKWVIRPTAPFTSNRYYLEQTCVLVTEFHTDTGCVSVTDWMPSAGEEAPGLPEAEHELRRLVHGLDGEVEIQVAFEPSKAFGNGCFRFKDRGAFGLESYGNRSVLRLLCDRHLPLSAEASSATARFSVKEGQEVHFAFSYSSEAPDVIPSLGHISWSSLDQTSNAWRGWVNRSSYRGPYAAHVARSALMLKLLTFAPSGAVIAAPTTSLPETPGGAMNWDYRFCWLRDAAFTTRAYMGLGYLDEAEAFVNWMLHTTRLTWPELKIMYDIYGRPIPPERELKGVTGFKGALPVRTGNAANKQVQLDVYGEVIDAAATLIMTTGVIDGDTHKLLVKTGEYVCENWEAPDYGIWELRGEPKQYVHSKLMAWVALDRLLLLEEKGYLKKRFPRDRFETNRHLIAQSIRSHGWNEDIGAYTQSYGSSILDASLLLMPIYGFEEAGSPRMRSTFRAVDEQLGSDGMLYRFSDGGRDEGAFGICAFWGVEFLIYSGRLDEARARFEKLLAHANDVGLFSEEEDPKSGRFLGNFPQTFTHIGLINAALTLERAENERLEEERPSGGSYRATEEASP